GLDLGDLEGARSKGLAFRRWTRVQDPQCDVPSVDGFSRRGWSSETPSAPPRSMGGVSRRGERRSARGRSPRRIVDYRQTPRIEEVRASSSAIPSPIPRVDACSATPQRSETKTKTMRQALLGCALL